MLPASRAEELQKLVWMEPHPQTGGLYCTNWFETLLVLARCHEHAAGSAMLDSERVISADAGLDAKAYLPGSFTGMSQKQDQIFPRPEEVCHDR